MKNRSKLNYSKNNHCICGQLISNHAKYCQSCAQKFYIQNNKEKITGELAHNYKHGKTNNNKCIDCDKRILWDSVRCSSCAQKFLWQQEKHRNKMIKLQKLGMKIKPNKPEKLLSKLLNKLFPNEYKFVGNGNIIFNGFNPDFININGQKKIIELYGDYWHNLPKVIKRDKLRLGSYKKYGYRTLVIWEHELTKIPKLKRKILQFQGGL